MQGFSLHMAWEDSPLGKEGSRVFIFSVKAPGEKDDDSF